MSAIERNKKWITLLVVITFIWLAYITNVPLRAATESDNALPMSIEKSSPREPVVKKKSILPLVLISIGVLAAAAAVYFLVIKKGKDKENVHDDFTSAADPLWLPRTASAWSVAGGYYICQKASGGADNTKWWEWSLYNRSWSKPNYTITTRMRITDHVGPFGLLLVNDANMEAVNGYQIMFYGNGNYFVRKVEGWNYKASTATHFDWIKEWTSSPAIMPGLNTWNTYKLVKTGSDYQLFANDTVVFSFNDATYDPRFVAVTVHTQVSAMHLEVDSFYVDVN
jgi:hypothetical protein